MQEGSLVYTNTGFTSVDGVIPFNHHTTCVYVLNLDHNTYGTIILNEKYQITVANTPSGGSGVYVRIPGDYTSIRAITAGITFSVYAVG